MGFRHMRRLFTGITIAGAMLLGVATSASADTFTFNFCPAAASECTGDQVQTAQLSFAEIANADPNDYTLTATITGGPAGYIDELLISIGSLQFAGSTSTTDDFTQFTLVSVTPSNGNYTGPYSDVIPGCSTDAPGTNDACIAATGGLGNVSGSGLTSTFVFTVNLVDTATAITSTTAMNFRFEFEDANGNNLGIFSPEGVNNTTTSTTTTTTTTTNNTTTSPSTVPEPGILALLGAGFGAAAQRLRRRRNG
jgi:hypothetical protein